jgi:hypothetical protein
MKMKKSIRLLATTTASSLIVTMTTGCGTDEKLPEAHQDNHKQSAESADQTNGGKFNFKINKVEGSVDINRCGLRCVMTEK